MEPVRNMKRGSAKNAASASASTNAVNVSIRCFTASSELSASSGKCQGTGGKGKSIGRRGDREMGRKGNQNIRRLEDKETRRYGDAVMGE
ncbi:MAG: hypothetical protein ABSG44_16940 [Thermodesulfobacteriota bacterium]